MKDWSQKDGEWKARRLRQFQTMPLKAKIILSQSRIRQFSDHFLGEVYISFSGGKVSTVLLDLVRSIYPKIPAVFADTGLEYPEIRDFVKTVDNVVWVKPKMNFKKVLDSYGFPIVSKRVARMIHDCQCPSTKNKATRKLRLTGIKRDGTKGASLSILPEKWKFLISSPFKISDKCCDVMKKNPLNNYQRQVRKFPFIGMLANESNARKIFYLKRGCNIFDGTFPQSNPLSFWLEQDIWDYIKQNKISYSKIYDMGVKRTGCMFCMFGVHLEKEPNRFQLMKKTHPKQYNYCINKLGCGKVLDYINVKY